MVGSIELVSKKVIKLDNNLIYSWAIALGLSVSILLRLAFGETPSVIEFTFPLLWFMLPLFLVYWKNRSRISLLNFPEIFFLLNFSYAFIQLLASRILGYSLMVHRTFSEYQIQNYAQDTPFSYLGLSGIHSFLSSNLGSAVTGLVVERIDFMILSIICILRLAPFNYKNVVNAIQKGNGIFRLISVTNIVLALFFLTISGSSLSLFIILLPFLWIINITNRKILFRIRGIKLSERLKAVLSTIFFTAIILLFLLVLFDLFTQIVQNFDQSRRIAALNDFSSVFKDWTSNLGQLMYGNGVSTTSDFSTEEVKDSLLPRSLDVFGYTFNSFGLLGLVPFLTCYPLLLRSQTTLKWPSIFLLSAFAFAAAGSPLSYNYTYALILLPPNDLVDKEARSQQELSNA